MSIQLHAKSVLLQSGPSNINIYHQKKLKTMPLSDLFKCPLTPLIVMVNTHSLNITFGKEVMLQYI